MTRPGYAKARDVEVQAGLWDESVLQCRTYGHVWQPLRATWNKRLGYYAVVQRCSRCRSERNQELSARGHVYASWIDYAEGYLSEGLGRIVGEARDVVRLATVTRAYDLEKLSAKDSREDVPHSSVTRRALGISLDGQVS